MTFNGIVLYLLIWWICLFVVLPIGARPVAEPDAVTGWRGLPAQPHLLRRLIATTLLAAIVWAMCLVVISRPNWLSFRHGLLALPQD